MLSHENVARFPDDVQEFLRPHEGNMFGIDGWSFVDARARVESGGVMVLLCSKTFGPDDTVLQWWYDCQRREFVLNDVPWCDFDENEWNIVARTEVFRHVLEFVSADSGAVRRFFHDKSRLLSFSTISLG
jgi:hypothetical protein